MGNWRPFRRYRAPDLLIQVSPERIVVENLKTGETASCSPVVRVSGDGSAHKFAHGDAEVVPHTADRSGKVVNGFGHPRILVSDFLAAAFALKQTAADVVDFDFQLLWFSKVGRVLIQPLRSFEEVDSHQSSFRPSWTLAMSSTPESVTVYVREEPLSSVEALKVLEERPGQRNPVRMLGRQLTRPPCKPTMAIGKTRLF